MKNKLIPMNLQIFADPAGGDPASAAQQSQGQQQSQQTTENQQQAPEIDYDKIAQLVSGKQAVAEESVLKGYFKQQGLSKEEMDQAINTFKQQKAAQQPDVGALQSQLSAAQQAAQQEAIKSAAVLAGIGLGLDAKSIPHLIKMADMSKTVGEDGKINEEAVKAAINQVLEDIPALKPQQAQTAGFVQVGAGGNQGQAQTAVEDQLDRAFGIKKK